MHALCLSARSPPTLPALSPVERVFAQLLPAGYSDTLGRIICLLMNPKAGPVDVLCFHGDC